jgi:hypothetical protein
MSIPSVDAPCSFIFSFIRSVIPCSELHVFLPVAVEGTCSVPSVFSLPRATSCISNLGSENDFSKHPPRSGKMTPLSIANLGA